MSHQPLSSLCPHPNCWVGRGPWGQRGHRCKKLLAPFSIIMLPPKKLLVLGCPPSSQCLQALPRDMGCEIREVFSLSPTLLPRDQRLLWLLDVSPGLPQPLHIPHQQISHLPHEEPLPVGEGFQIFQGQGRFPAFTFPWVNSEVNWFNAAAWP